MARQAYKICGVPYPDDTTIICTMPPGHGRVRGIYAGKAADPVEADWFKHANPGAGVWWNAEPEPDVAVPRPILPPDISIPRQDGQPFGDRYLTYHHEDGLVGVVAPREGVVDLAAGMMYSYPVPPEPQPVVDTEVEIWYGVFNDPATLLPKFESGEIHAGLRETLLDTPIFESRNLGDVLRHAQLTWEDRQVQHRDKVRVAEAQLLAPTRVVDGKLVRITPEVPPPTPIVIKTQTLTRTGWAIVPPDVLKNVVGGPAIREVSM